MERFFVRGLAVVGVLYFAQVLLSNIIVPIIYDSGTFFELFSDPFWAALTLITLLIGFLGVIGSIKLFKYNQHGIFLVLLAIFIDVLLTSLDLLFFNANPAAVNELSRNKLFFPLYFLQLGILITIFSYLLVRRKIIAEMNNPSLIN